MTLAADAAVAGAPCPRPRPHLRRRAGIGLLVLGATGLVGAGALASWTTTTTTSTGTVSAATAAVTILDANGSAFTAQMPDLLPGDYFYRYVDLRNDGTTASMFTGLVSATGDLAGALSASVDRCSISWSSTGSCLGAISSQAPETTIDQTGMPVAYGNIGSGPGGVAHERYRFKLADSAPVSLQGKTGTIAVTVTGATTGGRDRTSG